VRRWLSFSAGENAISSCRNDSSQWLITFGKLRSGKSAEIVSAKKQDLELSFLTFSIWLEINWRHPDRWKSVLKRFERWSFRGLTIRQWRTSSRIESKLRNSSDCNWNESTINKFNDKRKSLTFYILQIYNELAHKIKMWIKRQNFVLLLSY